MSGRYGAQVALGALLEARRHLDHSIRTIVMHLCLDERGNPIHMHGKPALEHLREHHPDAAVIEGGGVSLPSVGDDLANEALAAIPGRWIQSAVREIKRWRAAELDGLYQLSGRYGREWWFVAAGVAVELQIDELDLRGLWPAPRALAA